MNYGKLVTILLIIVIIATAIFGVGIVGAAVSPPTNIALHAYPGHQGVFLLSWRQNSDSDQIVVFNPRNTACPYPTIKPSHVGSNSQAIPEGPPFDTNCLLRKGDQLFLIEYKANHFVQYVGPIEIRGKPVIHCNKKRGCIGVS